MRKVAMYHSLTTRPQKGIVREIKPDSRTVVNTYQLKVSAQPEYSVTLDRHTMSYGVWMQHDVLNNWSGCGRCSEDVVRTRENWEEISGKVVSNIWLNQGCASGNMCSLVRCDMIPTIRSERIWTIFALLVDAYLCRIGIYLACYALKTKGIGCRVFHTLQLGWRKRKNDSLFMRAFEVNEIKKILYFPVDHSNAKESFTLLKGNGNML